MKILKYRLICTHTICSVLAFIFIAVTSSLSAQTYTVPSTSTTGTYAVSYSTPSTYALIDELVGGSWRTIGGGNKSGSISVTKTANGTYTYRMQNCTAGQWGHSCVIVSGTKSITVNISNGGGSTPSSAGTVSYKYDALGRVIEVTYSNGTRIYYTYDKAGNRTQVIKTI